MPRRKREETDKISIRLDLTGIMKERVDELKKLYGAKTYKGLVEMLITERYMRAQKEEEDKQREEEEPEK